MYSIYCGSPSHSSTWVTILDKQDNFTSDTCCYLYFLTSEIAEVAIAVLHDIYTDILLFILLNLQLCEKYLLLANIRLPAL